MSRLVPAVVHEWEGRCDYTTSQPRGPQHDRKEEETHAQSCLTAVKSEVASVVMFARSNFSFHLCQ